MYFTVSLACGITILSSAFTRRCVFLTSSASLHAIVLMLAICVRSERSSKKSFITSSLSAKVPSIEEKSSLLGRFTSIVVNVIPPTTTGFFVISNLYFTACAMRSTRSPPTAISMFLSAGYALAIHLSISRSRSFIFSTMRISSITRISRFCSRRS